jgi:CO/xanthine dehydrogenase FAD-binding subunit
MGIYLRPDSLSDALEALRANPCVILAGGTDFYPARVGRALDDDVLDITALDELRGVSQAEDHWRIGALTTWTDIIEAPLPACFRSLKLAARELGGVQIQNAGTIAGNLCNASPAADGVPPLIALDASVELASASGTRLLALGDFITGNRDTARGPDEVVTAIRVPRRSAATASTFLKLGSRKYLVISIVMVAVTLEPRDGAVGRVAIAVGACSPVAQRLTVLEDALTGAALASDLAGMVEAQHIEAALTPIDDIRGSGAYRREAALTLVRRALTEVRGETGGPP